MIIHALNINEMLLLISQVK